MRKVVVVLCVLFTGLLVAAVSAQYWEEVASLNVGRRGHATVLLHDGRVLTLGGHNSQLGYQSTSEIFDVNTGTWRLVGSMPSGLMDHAAVVLNDGRVLVSGGNTGSIRDDVYIFDPKTELWTETSPMLWHRVGHTLTLLPSGDVLVAGGQGYRDFEDPGVSAILPCELFNATTETWGRTGSLKNGHTNHAATLLKENQYVLVSGSGSKTSELYDIETGVWVAEAPMNCPHTDHIASLLNDGRVLVAGGASGSGNGYCTEIYDPLTREWTRIINLEDDVISEHSQVVLTNGSVMLMGGMSCDPGCYYANNRVQIYDVQADSWTFGVPMKVARASAENFVQFPDGRILMVGGDAWDSSSSRSLSSCEMFYPGNSTRTLDNV